MEKKWKGGNEFLCITQSSQIFSPQGSGLVSRGLQNELVRSTAFVGCMRPQTHPFDRYFNLALHTCDSNINEQHRPSLTNAYWFQLLLWHALSGGDSKGMRLHSLCNPLSNHMISLCAYCAGATFRESSWKAPDVFQSDEGNGTDASQS
jgi:hypothetical protein